MEQGSLTREQLDLELVEYEESQKEYFADREYFPPEVPYHKQYDVYIDLFVKLLRRVANILTKPEAVSKTSGRIGNGLLTIGIPFNGALHGRFVFALSKDKVDEVVVATLTQAADGVEQEMLLDAVKEFGNVVCGNVAARMAQMGREVEIDPPEVLSPLGGQGYSPKPGESVWLCPLVTTSGEVYAALVMGAPRPAKPAAKPEAKPAAPPRPKPRKAARPRPKPARKKAAKRTRPAAHKPARRPAKAARKSSPKRRARR
ncbi:MAG: chemotaxis protein CheX [Nitrospirae bacterium]|nr:chemotaxis protein CheX [Nitrospirota bacterium]